MENKYVRTVSDEVKESISNKSAQKLPNNPSARGMSADQIRRAFYAPIIDANDSLIEEIDRVANEANAALNTLDGSVTTAHRNIDGVRNSVDALAINVSQKIDRVPPLSGVEYTVAVVKETGESTSLSVGTADYSQIPLREPNTGRIKVGDPSAADDAVNLRTLEQKASDINKDIKKNADNIHAHNQWLEDLASADDAINTEVEALSVKVSGNASSYVIPTFYRFVNEFLAYGSTEGADVSDMITGSNILIAETDVPDFWFEKTTDDSRADSYTPTGSETAIKLVVYVNSVVVGVCHILETDYTVIEGHTISAQKSANEAKKSADDAKQTATDLKGDFEEYVQSLLDTIEGELDGIIAIQEGLIGGGV